ncbi:MAG: 4-hydroxy-tetrahydrodipicolinate synthase [Desulfovibrio sp.]
MSQRPPFVAEGVIPAALLPFKPNYEIDFDDYRSHLRDLAKVKGVTAICINGHAAQIPTLTDEEQRLLVEHTVDEVGKDVAVVVGVYAEGSAKAAGIAAMAEKCGASALLVFPPHFMYRGGSLRPEMALTHHKMIAEASKLPMVLFQYNHASGLMYPDETLRRLCVEIPSVVAIKDGCGDPVRHEHNIRQLRALDRPVNVLTTHSAWLLSSLVLGCTGLLSGAGSTIADLQAAILAAVKTNDLQRARELSDRLYPMTRVYYAAQPLLDMHNRMKEVLAYLGRIKCAVVRPPECKIPEDELARITAAVDSVGLKKDGFTNLQY